MRSRRSGAPTAATAAASVLVLSGLTACSSERAAVDFADAVAEPIVAAAGASAASVASSRAAFAASDVVFLATGDSVDQLADNSREAHLPLLVAGHDDVAAEIDRLGADTLVVAEGSDAPEALTDDHATIEVDPDATTEAMSLPSLDTDDAHAPVTAVLDPTADHDRSAAVVTANVRAAGGHAIEVPGGDPRATRATVRATTAAKETSWVAVGGSFGTSEQLAARVETATSVPQLPGGGQTVFPGRRLVGLYGTPGTSELGPLGEQGIEASIERAKGLAGDYDDHSEVPVLPAFEIIATVADSEPGADGDHSREVDPASLRPWVEAAGDAGVYVVLDLQPGHSDFLTQAKRYEDLLREPHVGLALDPEWRLEPGQRHMDQIGSVAIDEVNATADWLARLTREHSLPQKTFLLHQFSSHMIADREQLDTSHEELATVLHADGHGTPGLKMGTWRRLQQDLPEDVWMGWKNFYDEDTPTFTPERTYDLEPRPWFVSYQ
ncbi:hypothetical protein O9K63_00225 [Janibacter cremeus]|uniref:hypothetical protein n=1 Tax=Janibacter cremeus TaxID=1285192 RepID=UPI0023F9CEE0|nr:hypothetical protein [Janibacter cremeus]WEV78175.1 hypothetical protein O9K63_16565 [Janibacter cremeus]WEV78255.1 hypothetical protein O9K63_00225 [Janibacter cremeus]